MDVRADVDDLGGVEKKRQSFSWGLEAKTGGPCRFIEVFC